MMKIQTCLLGLLFLSISSVAAWSQFETVDDSVPVAPSAPALVAPLTRALSAQNSRVLLRSSLATNSEADRKLQQAIENYRNAGDDSQARQAARVEINSLLSEKYDTLLKNQEEELNQMEQRLAKLRDQMKQRRDAKQKMVDLKLEMVLAQADGLGWPEDRFQYNDDISRYFHQQALEKNIRVFGEPTALFPASASERMEVESQRARESSSSPGS